ncbi:Wd40 repeat-like protein, partial [Globisporangium splendens]
MTTPLVKFRGHRDSVSALLVEEDKHPHVLASGSDDGSCRLWDVRTTRATRSMNIKKALGLTSDDDQDESAVNSMVFSANGDYIHVAAGNKVLTFDLRQEGLIFNCASKEILQDNDDEINALSRHPGKQGKYLSAPDDNGDIRIYDMEAHRLYKTLRGQHVNICSAAPFRPNAPWDLVSGGMDGFLLFWDFSRGRMKFKIDLNTGVNSLDSVGGASSATAGVNQMFNPPLVHSIAFAPNGKSFAAGLGDASIAIVDFSSKQMVRRLKQHSAAVSQVHFPVFKPNEWLLSSGNDAKICVWDYQHALNNPGTGDHASDDSTTAANNLDIVKEFAVERKPNAITTCLHQNLVLVSDVSKEISAYPLL